MHRRLKPASIKNYTMQEFIVSNLEDENDGDFSEGNLSLREAIATAESGDTISFDSDLSGSTINLSLGELIIDKNLTINGLGEDQLTIDGGGNSRIFNIDDGNEELSLEVAIGGLTIINGNSSTNGGGIFTRENLELANSTVSGNGVIFDGAGIYSSGERLLVIESTIDGNSAPSSGGRAPSRGGGITTVGTNVDIVSSQITDNRSSGGGGGVDVRDSNLIVADSIISGNFGTKAGGIAVENSTVDIEVTRVSGNETSIYGGSGAIDADSNSVLTIDRSTIDANSGVDPYDPYPPRGSEAFASGIGARGTTTITNSTISNSTVVRIDDPVPPDSPRGQVPESVIGFGVRNTGSLDVSNSTFAGNADGGISNEGGTVNISNSTVADRLANIDLTGGNSNATVVSTIVVDDTQELEAAIDANQNLIGNTDDLSLGELDTNDLFATVALSEDSQAIDAGSNPNNLATDQRGFDRTVGTGTDIGAFELQADESSEPEEPIDPEVATQLIVSTFDDENDGDFSEGDLSLREAIAISNSNDTIGFAEDLSGGTILLSLGELSIDKSLTINGLGSDRLTVDANNSSRVFNLNDGTETKIDVTIDGLTITGGNASTEELGNFGGGIFNQENLELNNSQIIDNDAVAGGGIYNFDATANINNTAIANNSIPGNNLVESRGAGIANLRSTVEVNNSSIEDNIGTGIDLQASEIIITDSSVSNNNDIGTGGIRATSASTVRLRNSQVNNNSASALGLSGGITSLEDSTLDIGNSTISGNFGDPGGASDPRSRSADSSGILASGTTFISNSTISGNRGIGFGIINRGGFSLNIINSTFADNEGTAVVNQTNGTTFIGNSTIANNAASNVEGLQAGGIVNSGGNVALSSSIVANNGEAGTPDIAIASNAQFSADGGDNLIGNGENLVGLSNSDLVGTADNLIDPQLGELQNNGGNTLTLALSPDSPGIDRGGEPASDNLPFDQRGEGFNRRVGANIDIGAFELQDITTEVPTDLIVSTSEDENDGDFSEGDLSLREAIAIAESGNIITFDSALSGSTITLALGELAIDSSLTIQGLGAENIIIDANGNSRVFNIDDGNEDTQIDVALNSLAITGSEVGDDGEIESFDNGGGILNSENLEINNADIYNNQAALEGGGIYSDGTLTVNNSAIYSNSVGDVRDRTVAGGGIYSNGILTVNNSAIYSNSGSGNFGGAAGGGITNTGTATINQSTISSNSVGGRGNSAGGIENREGDLTITNSTISNNSSNLTSGIFNNSGEVTVTSTIIANVGNRDISGDDFVSGGNNFVSGEAEANFRGIPVTISAEGFTDGENGDIVGTLENPIDPLLGELQNNGGRTPTQALLEGSPTIDAGSNPNNSATDQRGQGFDRTVGAGTDIGAFEVQDGGNNQPEQPDVQVPDIQVPVIEVPDIQVPDIQVPEPGDLINDFFGTDGDDSLSGEGDNDDVISGGAGHDTLDGNDGHDNISGGTGDDLILGGAGDDLLDGNEGHNTISGENGHDTLFGGEDNDTLTGGEGNDLLVGAGGHDSLLGSNGHDVINGGAGDDFINGDGGDDLLTGGAGADTLLGGDGHDIFVLESFDSHDTIIDFELEGDRLQLSESLTLGQLTIVDNESNTGALILDSHNNDAVIASVENIHAADLDIHLFC